MNPPLDRLQKELEAAIANADPRALSRAPEGKWSPHQILEHLWLTYRNTNKGLARCMEKDAPLATQPTFRHRIRRFVVVRLQYFPGGAEAPERAVPKGAPPDEVMGTIFAEVARMDAGFTACENKFGLRARILDHPVLGPLTSHEWRTFHWLHAGHHARQIRKRLSHS